MTNEEHERFTIVMVKKYAWMQGSYLTREEAFESIISGVVVDTSLLLDGTVPLAKWEDPDSEFWLKEIKETNGIGG